MTSKTYNTKAKCTNCDLKENIEIPFGTKIDEFLCPKCGCKELKTKSEYTKIKIRR